MAGVRYQDVAAAFELTGLSLRGGFGKPAQDAPEGTLAVVLVGNAGADFWPAFEAGRRSEPDPMDAWTRRVVGPIADRLGADAVYPSDRPYRPFQAWAQLAEPVTPSPLGILIHPVYGLWHAYRAALLFPFALEGIPARAQAPSPCVSCAAKPCLSACPVAAFDGTRYDVAACAGHLKSCAPPDCANLGCRARDACPVGPEWRYPQAQVRFHMDAFVRSRGGPWGAG